MIWVTGDTHGEIKSFKRENINKIKKGDSLIICGDFGFVWSGDKTEQNYIKWLGKRKYYVLFVEGCNENYKLLNEYPIIPFADGKARQISGNLLQLIRGEVYNIGGKKVFAFGGGKNENSDFLDKNTESLIAETPSPVEIKNGFDNLQKHNNTVDLIITHDAPASIKAFINMEDNEQDLIHWTLEDYKNKCDFKLWCFGKYHQNKVIPPYYQQLFEKVIRIN